MKEEEKEHWFLIVAVFLIALFMAGFLMTTGCVTTPKLPPVPSPAEGKEWRTYPIASPDAECIPHTNAGFIYEGEYFQSIEQCDAYVKLKWPAETDRYGTRAWKVKAQKK